MASINYAKLNKSFLCELPYFGKNIFVCHGQFNNLVPSNLPTKRYLERLPSLHDIDLFSLNVHEKSDFDSDLTPFKPIRCKYYSPHSFSKLKNKVNTDSQGRNFSFLHNNIRSLKHNLENFQTHLLSELGHHFDIIGVTETRIRNSNFTFNPEIPGYNFEYVPTPLSAGGVGMYIDTDLKYSVIEKTSNEAFQALWVEIFFPNKANALCGVIYRQHNSPTQFQEYFNETIEKFSASGKSIYLLSDTNINLLHSSSCHYAENFLLFLQSLNLLPTIDKPTRVHNNSASLIDNIFINNLANEIVSGNLITDISDHFAQFCILRSNVVKPKPGKRVMRDYSQFSENDFLHDLQQINWEINVTASENDTDRLFSSFYNKLNKLVNKHAPFKPISKRKQRMMSKPWITKGIRASIKTKNKLLTMGNYELYKSYRNKIVTLTRISKKNYYHNFFQVNINNAKATWEGINSLINNKSKPRKEISAIKRPNKQLSYDPLEHADILNHHFSTIGPKLATNIPNCDNKFRHYLPRLKYNSSFVFDPVSPYEIELEIIQIPLNKSTGLYSCPTRLLKIARHVIATPLSTLINLSVENGYFPSKLKHAKIIPIFKEGDDTDPSNFRPISLLSIFNRIFEKMMCNRIKRFFDKHDIFFKSQYGFREKRSTDHAILDIVSKIQKNMDNGMFSCGVFIDLQKAFDTVDHKTLLHKLQHYGIRGVIIDWFCSYLTDRCQTTQIGTNISKKEKVVCGVPQGSVLGPLLFLIYVNDIYNASSKLDFYLFADDTNILYADKNLRSLETTVNTELLKVHEWLNANKLSLNIKKSNFTIFHTYQKRINYEVTLMMYDNQSSKFIALEHKEYVKYLGVLIDSNLSWKYHITHVASKISKNIGIIARLRHFTPFSTLLHIYNSLILPYLSYGLVAWGQACKTHFQKILVLQKRAVRLMHFAQFRDHAIPLFVSAGILPLHMLYFKISSVLMLDVKNKSIASNISDLFTLTQDVHNYNTRQSTSSNYYINYSCLNVHKNSFAIVGAKMWNSLPEKIRLLPKRRFKLKLKQALFKILINVDEYIDIDKLIHEMKVTDLSEIF